MKLVGNKYQLAENYFHSISSIFRFSPFFFYMTNRMRDNSFERKYVFENNYLDFQFTFLLLEFQVVHLFVSHSIETLKIPISCQRKPFRYKRNLISHNKMHIHSTFTPYFIVKTIKRKKYHS